MALQPFGKLEAFFMKKLSFMLMAFVTVGLSTSGHADDQLHQRDRYKLHIGDSIDLNYRLTPEFNQTITIEPDGYGSLNIAGDVKLEGLTLQQAHDLIVEKDSVRLNQPELNLVLSNFQKPYVVVGGNVAQPGKIELREELTALQAILLAGGFVDTAKQSKVLVFRHINGDLGEVHQLNLYKVDKTVKLEHDMALESGDMIMVPTNNLAHFARIMHAVDFGTGLSLPIY
jgi:polysaccharide biosynthesis/export protein